MKRNLVGKILGKIKIFVQDFVPIRTALRGSFFLICSSALQWHSYDRTFLEHSSHTWGKKKGPALCLCVFSSHSFWTSMDVPAGVTQEEGNTGFSIHLLSAVLALIFLARRIKDSAIPFPRRP